MIYDEPNNAANFLSVTELSIKSFCKFGQEAIWKTGVLMFSEHLKVKQPG